MKQYLYIFNRYLFLDDVSVFLATLLVRTSSNLSSTTSLPPTGAPMGAEGAWLRRQMEQFTCTTLVLARPKIRASVKTSPVKTNQATLEALVSRYSVIHSAGMESVSSK